MSKQQQRADYEGVAAKILTTALRESVDPGAAFLSLMMAAATMHIEGGGELPFFEESASQVWQMMKGRK